MDTILDTEVLENFLAKTVFHEKLKSLQKINRGGTSVNFKAITSSGCYAVKLLPNKNKNRISRLCNILTSLNDYPDFCTAHLYNNLEPVIYKDCTIIVTNFIAGKKLKYFELNANVMQNIITNYEQFQKITFAPEKLAYPMRTAKQLYNDNKKLLQNISQTAKPYQRNIVNTLENYNKIFYNLTPSLNNKKISIIHGDASLNNMLFNHKGEAYFLDLELIRYGYPFEDAAELLLSALLPHYIFTLPKKRLTNLINEINSIAHFKTEEWIYGICHHFLYFICRRLRGSKLFTSYRKDWLFLQYLKKFSKIIKLVKEL